MSLSYCVCQYCSNAMSWTSCGVSTSIPKVLGNIYILAFALIFTLLFTTKLWICFAEVANSFYCCVIIKVHLMRIA